MTPITHSSYIPYPLQHSQKAQQIAVELTHLSHRMAGKTLLDDVSLSIPLQTAYGIFGHRHAGKTVLLKALLGLLPGSQGTGHVLGYDIRSEGPEIRKYTGYAAGGWQLPSNVTVTAYLTHLMKLRGTPEGEVRELVASVLHFLGLLPYQDVQLGKIASQDTFRVVLAQSLVHKPKLLILDDIASFLGPQSRQKYYAILKALLAIDDLTIILASSDAEHFLDVVSTGAFIDGGRILGSGDLESLACEYGASTLHDLYLCLATSSPRVNT